MHHEDEQNGHPAIRSVSYENPCSGLFLSMIHHPEVSDHPVFLIEQGNAGMQVGYQHDIPLDVRVGGKEETALGPEMFPVHVEPLETLVGPVADDEFRRSVTGVEPLTMWRLKLSVRRPATADCTKVVVLGVELMDEASAIAITQEIPPVR